MPSPGASPFGVLLNRHRTAAGLTQQELAERAGLSVRAISDLERGVNSRPQAHTIHQLARAFHLSDADAALFAQSGRGVVSRSPALSMARTIPSGGFLGAIPIGPLVAREQELERVLAAVSTVRAGTGQLVLLSGEAGVGKTRLAQEVSLALRTSGFLVATGRCYQAEGTLPFHPFLEALEHLHLSAPAETRAEIPQRWPYLHRLLPERSVTPEMGRRDDREEQQKLFRSVTDFIATLAEEAPVALLLDDLQWADESSIALLLYLARHSRAYPLLLLGTIRDSDVIREHPVEIAVQDLDHEQLVERVALRGFNKEGTTALLTQGMGLPGVSAEFAGLLHERTDGNPFFAQQVVRALVEQGDADRREGEWNRQALEDLEVPGSVRAAIYQRVSHLQTATRKVLHEASVLGQIFAFDDVQAVTGLPEDDLDQALQEARSVGLVRVMGRGTYRFDHALTQQALYADLSPRRQRALHRAVGEALGRLPERRRMERAAELAWHYVQGDELERALTYSLIAGDQAEAVFAHAEAEQNYRQAQDLAQEIGDAVREGEALLKLGRVLHTVARYDDALVVLERAAHIYGSSGELQGVGEVTAQIGRVHYLRGTPEEGINRTQHVLTLLEPRGPSSTLAALYVTLATLLWASGRFTEQLAITEQAGMVAQAMQDDRILVEVRFWRGYALLALDRVHEGLPELDEVIILAEAVGDLTSLSRALNAIGVVYEEMGDFQREKPYLTRSLEVAEHRRDPSLVAFITHRCAERAFWAGEWREARDFIRQAVTLDTEIGPSWASPYLLNGAGRISLAEGDESSASRYLEDARKIAEHNKDQRALRIIHNSLAERDLLIGRPQSALTGLQHVAPQPGARRGDSFNELMSRVILAQAYLALDDVTQAETIVRDVIEQTDPTLETPIMVEALRVQGMVAARQHRWTDADRAFEQALHAATPMGYLYGAARILSERGTMNIRRGDPDRAREALEAALEIFRGLGARSGAESAEQSLAHLS
ncbi:MAG: hypothetical protein NVS2B16_30710 [Chloroflexota bacterium]